MRSLELAAEMKHQGAQVLGFVCNDDTTCLKMLNAQGFRAWTESAEEDVLTDVLVRDSVTELVIDTPAENRRTFSRAREVRGDLYIVSLDHFDMENDDVDLIVNLINHHPTMPAPASERVCHAEGPDYAIIRRQFDAFLQKERKFPERDLQVIVTFGGSDPGRNTIKVMEALAEPSRAIESAVIIVGSNFEHGELVASKAAEISCPCQVLRGIGNIAEIMSSSDMGISGGGTTMLEMMSVGTPSMVIAQHEHELRFAEYFAKHGAVYPVGLGPHVTSTHVRDAIDRIASGRDARRSMSERGRGLVDGRGRHRIVSLILDRATSVESVA